MLQIKNISKQYKTGDLIQNALNDVSLNFRDNEFVSILGPSGSGKTTLLNIIGGLDRYDKGDLIIKDVSTKHYKDRDWDSYRNHTIGFVFQSYNLIPHQSVLSNVELALTISGISKKERRKRAIDALAKVGLKEQIHKKPNQMSGGQMQRVAIARALVNNPDILLADEPTGALDTETSVQVMELLKQVANDRLVIMVTHNPELAEQYSTRIVKLKDGKILGDTNPFNPDIENEKAPKHKNLGKASMSLFTAFSLSLKNLLTKKGRTMLTSFAGSIGIIGIALILSLSTGFQNYIDQIQEDTLTSYPLTITKETADATSILLSSVAKNDEEEIDSDVVKESQVVRDMFSKIGTNDVKTFKKYLSEKSKTLDDMVSLIQYQYSVSPLIYTTNCNNEITQLNPSKLMSNLRGGSSSMLSGYGMSMMSVFNEMIDNSDMLQAQYELLSGKWANNFDEVMLILPESNSMSDLLVYSLGLREEEELNDMLTKIMKSEKVENDTKPLEFTYDQLMNIPLKLVDATSTYKYNEKYEIYEDMTEDKEFMKSVYDNSINLKIVGIITSKDKSSGAFSAGVGYTKKLTEYVINKASKSEIVKKQLQDEDVNVFNNKRFDDKNEDSGLDFQDMVSIDTDLLSSAFGSNISEKDISKMTEGYMKEISASLTADTSKAQNLFRDTLSTLTKNILNNYIDKNEINGIAVMKISDVESTVNDYLETEDSKSLLKKLENEYVIPSDTFKSMYSEMIIGFLKQYVNMMNEGYNYNTETQPSENIETQIPENVEVQIPDSIAGQLPDNFQLPENMQLPDNMELPENMQLPDNIELPDNIQIPDNITSNDSNSVVVDTSENIINRLENNEASAVLIKTRVDEIVNAFVNQEMIIQTSQTISSKMLEATMQKNVLTKVGELTGKLMQTMSEAFKVDESKFAAAFKFNLGEDEVKRLMESMSSMNTTQNSNTNLIKLGYQNFEEPTAISFYFKDFESKEKFIEFLDKYNEKMEKEDEDKVIKYTDLTGILMSSVKTIVDSVSYVLIAFVSISLIVSSIMIGIITYISVLERTKEIGILRAIGASKRNISSIFNAETFIVGLFAGAIGIIISLLLLIPINSVIKSVTGNVGITAVLPMNAGIILVILSIVLTLIGGIIPSKQAAKKDPVLALRTD